VSITKSERPFWDSIIAVRPPHAWRDSDLEVAAELARLKCQIEKLQRKLRTQPFTIEDGSGVEKPNPLYKLLESLVGKSISLARSINVHAPSERELRKDREQLKKVQGTLEARESLSDGLIPHVGLQ
jgi:hypothetical protein